MAQFKFTSPGGKSYVVQGPEGATAGQAFGVLQSQLKASGNLDYYKNLSAPTQVDAAEGMGVGEKFLAGVGMGMSRIGRGVGQLVGAVDQNEINQRHEDETDLANTGAGRAGAVTGTIAALAPTMLIPGANSVASATAIGAASGALTTEGGAKERAIGALGGGAGGVLGVGVGRALGAGVRALGNRAARIGVENAVTNESIAAAREAGYVLPPSEMAQSVPGRAVATAAESVSGKAATGQAASITNQRVTNNLVRADLGLRGRGQISGAELDGAMRPHLAVYAEAERVSPDAAEALRNWRAANFEAKRQMRFFGRTLDPAAEDAANAARAEANQWLQMVEQEAANSGNAGLAQRLARSRVELGRLGTVESAINEETGNVSARALAAVRERGVPLTGGMERAARFASAFPKYAQDSKSTGMAGVSKLAAGVAAAGTMALGPKALVIAAAPYAARNALLSRPVQALARPSMNPGATRQALGNALARPSVTNALARVGSAQGIETARPRNPLSRVRPE